ncbi:MAG: hypothetical protein DMG64_10930 [Acidobacteria bacterium]|nr:MAG: hypothetical protein DMG64_10930 [Acidobacteriota bacterium]PYY24099.1 MAG: hypothetical protein DMG62_05125 [Acidobacteriota bacterium]
MKKLVALFFIAGVTLCTAATANAQALKVAVPFDFVVGGNTLPAATYTIRESLPNDNRGLAFIGDHRGILTRATEIDDTVTGTKLVFRHIGDQYFLSDVVTLRGKLHFASSRKQTQRAQGAEGPSVTIIAANQ